MRDPGLGSGRLHGLDERAVRFLELHEARAHALGGRLIRDLGDCVLVHAPRDRDPFFNRVAAVRWPDAREAFDARLAEILALFVGLDRQPHVWESPAFGQPRDLVDRLVGHGFRDLGGGYVMLLVREPTSGPVPLPRGATLDAFEGGPGVTIGHGVIRDAGLVLANAFGVDPDEREAIEVEQVESLRSSAVSVRLLRVDGEPVAIGKRYTFDGASYLAAIGTRPGHRGHGYGSMVTDALVRDSLAAGARYVYLGVFADNEPAIAVYRRAGFDVLGSRARDLLLTRDGRPTDRR